MNVIATERENSLPANIKLANTTDLSGLFSMAHGLLREAPCNIVVNNHFAESPDYADLRAYLQETCDGLDTAKRNLHHDKFRDASQFFPEMPREGMPPSLSTLFNGLFAAMKNHHPERFVAYELRREWDQPSHFFHMDGTTRAEGNKEKIAAFSTRLIISLTRHGTLVAGHDSAAHAPVVRIFPEENTHDRYYLPAGRWKPAEDDTWGLQPLAIAFITHNSGPHVPVIHSPWSYAGGRKPEKRAIAVLDALAPRESP